LLRWPRSTSTPPSRKHTRSACRVPILGHQLELAIFGSDVFRAIGS
jgi:hypothetical protein